MTSALPTASVAVEPPLDHVLASGARPLTELGARLPRCLSLASLPTPVEQASLLEPGGRVWIKRDDLTNHLYGGGKIRKLEWLLASERYARPTVLSVGGLGSHHLTALAFFLRERGQRLHALTFDQPLTAHVEENIACVLSLGTRVWHVPNRSQLPLAWLEYQLSVRETERGAWMEPGGSSLLGTLGFVSAGLELARQVEEKRLPRPARIYVAGGSGGTPAGLILGLALARLSVEVCVVAAVERWLFNKWLLSAKLEQLRRLLASHGVPVVQSAKELCARARVSWSVDHGELGGCYGDPTPTAIGAVRAAAEQGLQLETTYSGKCLAALQRDLRNGTAPKGPLLFWNTHAGNDLSPHIARDWRLRASANGILSQPRVADGRARFAEGMALRHAANA